MQFKKDELLLRVINANVATANSASFKYTSGFLRESTAVGNNRVFKNVKCFNKVFK